MHGHRPRSGSAGQAEPIPAAPTRGTFASRSRSSALAAWLMLVGIGCRNEAQVICAEVVDCVESPCAVNSCQARLERFNEAEIQQALDCVEAYPQHDRCQAMIGGSCGQVLDAAQRCCWPKSPGQCKEPACQDVPQEDPWPVQCLGLKPSSIACDWVARCCPNEKDCKLGADVAEALYPRETKPSCASLMAAYDDPTYATDAADCRSCLARTPECTESATECGQMCGLELITGTQTSTDGGMTDGATDAAVM